MSMMSFQSIHIEHGGLMLARKVPADLRVYQEDVIIVGGESNCNSSGNPMKRQKIEV